MTGFKDFHTHTSFSDGKNTPEEMVLSAIEKGFSSIGITDHAFAGEKASWWMSKENTPVYIAELRRLQEKYKGQIDVLVGTEFDAYSIGGLDEYDYVIGSVHFVDKNGTWWPVDSKKETLLEGIEKDFSGDAYSFCEEYFRLLSGFADNPHIKIIGHFDLVEKFNEDGDVFDSSSPRYRETALETLRLLCKAGKTIEINTGAMFRVGKKHPYPADFILEEVARLGGKVCLSSDAHGTSAVGFEFDRAAELCKRFGLEM